MKGGTATKILLEVMFSMAHVFLKDHVITPPVTMYVTLSGGDDVTVFCW